MSEYNHGRLNNLIIEGHKHMDNLKGKSGVLLVGNTSAGKSYLVNYLIGWPLKKTRLTANKINNLKQNFNQESPIKQKKFAKDGHNIANSQTFFPKAYYDDESEFLYCDLAQPNDTRDIEEKICISILTEIAVKSMKTIRSIIVVISFNEFEAPSGQSFFNLCNTMGEILKNPDEISLASSLIFVITNVLDNTTTDNISSMIQEMIKEFQSKDEVFHDECQTYIKKNSSEKDLTLKTTTTNLNSYVEDYLSGLSDSQKKEFKERQKIITFLQRILDSKVLIGDVLNQGFRQEVIKCIKNSQRLSPDMFHIKGYDATTRNAYNELVFEIVNDGLLVMGKKQSLVSFIKQVEQKITDFKQIVAIYNFKEESQVGSKNQLLKRLFDQLKQKKEEALLILQQQEDKIKREVALINNDQPISYWKQDCQTKADYKFVYRDIPILDVKRTCSKGTFNNSIIDYQGGKYETTFSYMPGVKAQGNVEIFVRRKDLPDNRKIITHLLKKQEEIQKTTKYIEEADFDEMADNLVQRTMGGNDFIQLFNKVQESEAYKQKIQIQQELRKKASIELEILKKKLQEKQQQYSTIKKLSDIIDFKSKLVDSFRELYEQEFPMMAK